MSHCPNRDWFIDYNDLTTQSSPIAYTTGTIKLTNDGAWPYWNTAFPPAWVTSLWNTTTNQFNFSQLSIWDEVTLRFDVNLTTTQANQVIKFLVTFDIWGTQFDLTLDQQVFKTAGTYNIVETERFYIGSAGMKNNPWEIKFTSEGNDDATIVVNWFYLSAHRR